MSELTKGLLAMIVACVVWGLSPIYYKQLTHVPALEVLAHRAVWSLVFFAGVLALQRRLAEMRAALLARGSFWRIALASALISANWFLFIYATQLGRNTETSLGYYIFPLVAVLVGRFWFAERLNTAQWLAVGLAALAVGVLGFGTAGLPWMSLTLAGTFALYGLLKKELALGPVVSVTCEVVLVVPIALLVLIHLQSSGQTSFGTDVHDTVFLLGAGPITAVPLILFSFAARRISMSTLGLLQYINPSLQFICAVVIFAEPFTVWHGVAFPLIWSALAIYSLSALRQDWARRKAVIASPGVSTTVSKLRSEESAKP